MAPGNAQLHDRFCLSEKATRKTKQRKVIFGFNQRIAQHFWKWTCFVGNWSLKQYSVPFQKAPTKNHQFCKNILSGAMKNSTKTPTFAKQHQQRRLSEIRNPWYRLGISHRPDQTHVDHVVRCNKPRRRKLFKGLKRHGVKSTPGTKTWKTP